MCFGGGNGAAGAAAQAESQREAEISANVNSINQTFAGRQGQYQQYLNAAQNTYQTELNRQQATAGRNLKFALARGGLSGSSVAADQGAELGREQAQGTITAEQKAQGALTNLQAQDQSERLQLINEAQSGTDIGDAAQQTAQALSANLNAAQSNVNAAGLGDVFGGLATTYNNMNNAALTRKGLNNSLQYVYGNQSGQATGKGPFG